MFNRKKHLIKPPKLTIKEQHKIWNLLWEERGWYKINNDQITLWQDTCKPVEFTYLADYNWQEINLKLR